MFFFCFAKSLLKNPLIKDEYPNLHLFYNLLLLHQKFKFK